MNYPTSPYLGQLHIQDGNLWRWNGLTWGAITLKIPTSPSTSSSGDLTLEALEARITEIEEALNQSFLIIE